MAAPDCVDLLIIGGGINGTGIARDAAGRGHKVVLVEQSDLASATSSASTKLIHGGLRYLELFEFRLVREALMERERLLGIAPHIIRPMRFILPHVEGLRPRWQIKLGLFLYDHLGGRHRLPASHGMRLDTARDPVAASGLRPNLDYGFAYSDCWVDDSRLVVLNAMDAAQRGASIRTRTRFLTATPASVAKHEQRWNVQLEDQLSGVRSELQCRAIVNAAGPWVEKALHRIPGIRNDTQVRLVKGSHIVVPRMYAGAHAFTLQNPDGRVVFTVPYENEFTLIGTTDVAYDADPAAVQIGVDEIDYLCATVNEYFQQSITPDEVKWTYAGVRPLSDDDATNASKVTRDYKLELTANHAHPALLSVFGGKITTYRRLAETALQKLQPFIGGSTQSWTHTATLPGGDLPRGDFDAFLIGVKRRWPFLAPPLAQRLAHAYGTRVSDILGAAKSSEDLGQQFGAGLSAAEVDYLFEHEWAHAAEDILWRRTKLGLHMSATEQENFARYCAGRARTELPLAAG